MQLKKACISGKIDAYEVFEQSSEGQAEITFETFAKIMAKIDPKLSRIESLDLYENHFMMDKDQKIKFKTFVKKMEALKDL
jgi:tRNA splicing endonuclease